MPTTTATEQELAENRIENGDEKSKSELRSIRDITKDLSKPIAQKHLRKRRQGGKEIVYLAWHDAVKYLDHYAPGWCYEIRSIDSVSGKLIMIVRLSIPSAEGIVYREATGQEDEDLETYGNSSSNSESMALRRAASKFGLACIYMTRINDRKTLFV